MKLIKLMIPLLCLSGCVDFESLNEMIYNSQVNAVTNSQYQSARGTLVYVEAQKDFRLTKLSKLIKSKISSANLKDTIFITETFDEICINCPSDWMKILIKDTIYSIRSEAMGHTGKIKYIVEIEKFDPGISNFEYKLRNSEHIEIINKIRSGIHWLDNPLQYGSDNCLDGDHTIFTIIYPNKKIESMYVRCWMPYFYRNRE